MTDTNAANKVLLASLRAAMYDWTPDGVKAALQAVVAADAPMQLAFPFETMVGPADYFASALEPLAQAMPDLERRDWIVMSGTDPYGAEWVGCGGHYTGTFRSSLLGIPPTGHQVSMRFHEFYRVEGDKVVEMQALWDLPEVMMQAGVWPMGPSLGREWLVPGPATQDGIVSGPRDEARSTACVDHVVGMLGDMGRHPVEPVEAMRLEHWWHPKFSWYGPAGIGTGRGVDGFRRWHQIPFLAAMPDRSGGYRGESHFFGDGDFVGVTAWPGMSMTVTGAGWLGIAPTGRSITMRSLDFWRVEHDDLLGTRIRENWVLVDLLAVWNQLDVDVLGRMRELASARPGYQG